MAPAADEPAAARTNRYQRHRTHRQPLVVQAGAIVGHQVSRAIPVHTSNPAIQTALGLAEIVAFVALLLTGSTIAVAALLAAMAGFVVAHVIDVRAVVVLDENGDGTLLAARRSGRPTAVVGPAVLDAPLPTDPSGLSTRIGVGGRTWWIDRSSYRALHAAREVRRPL
jgi:hypothetical protein